MCRAILEGCKIFLPAMIATLAFIGGSVANFYCETVEFPTKKTDVTLYANAFSYRTITTIEWAGEEYLVNVCRSYRFLEAEYDFDYTVDAKARTVVAFSVIAMVFGAVGICVAYVLPCTKNLDPNHWKLMGLLLVLTSFFQGLTLLISRSSICNDNPVIQFISGFEPDLSARLPEECELSSGYKLGITSTALYFVAGALALIISPPDGSILAPIDLDPGEENNADAEKNDEAKPDAPAEEDPAVKEAATGEEEVPSE